MSVSLFLFCKQVHLYHLFQILHISNIIFVFLCLKYFTQNGWIIVVLFFSLLRDLHTVFHSGYYWFTFLPTVQEGSLFSTPSPAFIVCRLFDDGHSDKCEVIPHCNLICISLIISAVVYFFVYFEPSICLLWRTVCLDLLPIFFFLIGLFIYLFIFF